MKNVKTIHVLGLISIADFIFSDKSGGSIILWILYGFYKMAQPD